MKCLQCGTELDRLSKWRGSSEYCSEECKKRSQEEFNRLAMNRLMRPRPARTNAQTTAAAVRTVESSTGRLTVVTHPVGASSPIVTEPSEAGFIMDASATLVELQLRHQPPLIPRPLMPLIPDADLAMGDALQALEEMLAGIRPSQRTSRKLNPVGRDGFASAVGTVPALQLPACEPIWPASLGLTFNVAGIHSGPTAVEARAARSAPVAEATTPVAHLAIPPRRAARALSSLAAFELGSDRLVQPPVVVAPRLRIHLPKPVLNPFRPRYAFAPPPGEKNTKAAMDRDERRKPRAAKNKRPAFEIKEPGTASFAPAAKTEPQPDETSSVKRPAGQGAVETHSAEKDISKKPGAEAIAPEVQRVDKGTSAKDALAKPAAEKATAEVRVTEKDSIEKGLAKRPATEKATTEIPASVESFTAPMFGGKTNAEPEGLWGRLPGWQKAVAALLVVGIAVGAWAVPALNRGPGRSVTLPSAAAPAPSTMGADSWETNAAGDTTGIAVRRIISKYKPGRGKRDYIFEFTGQIEQRAIGWVFRMKDARNYYCLKLEKSGDGPGATAQLVKFAVVNGEEQSHKLVELREPLVATQPVRIRLDIRGQSFSTQVNGKPVDVWIDNQLSDGTVGFSNETGERAVIRTVKVTY
ncbi:MAG: hypothetical protein ACKV2U_33700 [Bryobacteraceae bacterium]